MTMCFLISYIAVSAFFFSIDKSNICYSIDSSSSEESIVVLCPIDNGLQFAPRCDGQCFLQQVECDHTIQKATLNHVGEYVVFPSMWYHHIVKRKGKGYNVQQIHIFHAKLALSDDEF
jgi:hypothetical protein